MGPHKVDGESEILQRGNGGGGEDEERPSKVEVGVRKEGRYEGKTEGKR